MRNVQMRGLKFLAAFILAGGLLFAAALFAFSGFYIPKELAVPAQAFQWTQQTGAGIFVPACGSSSASVTCSGGSPQVTFSWSAEACTGSVAILVNGSTIASGLPCSGSYTWGGASPNTTYSYEIRGQ